jgi:hypothetical protein
MLSAHINTSEAVKLEMLNVTRPYDCKEKRWAFISILSGNNSNVSSNPDVMAIPLIELIEALHKHPASNRHAMRHF